MPKVAPIMKESNAGARDLGRFQAGPDPDRPGPLAPGQKRRIAGRLLPGLGLAVIAGTLLFIFFGPRPPGPTTVAPGPATLGRPAPDFTTPMLDGGSIRLSQLRGHLLLINFWATWCTACRDEMPAIKAVWERHQSQGFQVLEVDYRETNATTMRDFMRGLGLQFGSALDPDGKIADSYGVTIGLPDSFFVDRHGVVRAIHLGQMTPDYIEQEVGILAND